MNTNVLCLNSQMGHYFFLGELKETFTRVLPIVPCENFNIQLSEQNFFQCFGVYEGFLCQNATDWVFVVFHNWDRRDHKCTGAERFAERCDADGLTMVRVDLLSGGVRFGFHDCGDEVACVVECTGS